MHLGLMLLLLLIIFLISPVICNDALVAAIDNLGYDIYREISSKPGNVVFSPVTIHAVLTLLYLGTSGKTEEELKSRLHLSDSQNFSDAYKKLFEVFTNQEATLTVPVDIFASNTYKLSQAYQVKASSTFGAKVNSVDFNKVDETVQIINKWVNSNTNGKITKIFDSDSLDSHTDIVLTSLIHLKKKWLEAFKLENTEHNATFAGPQKTVKCEMMSLKDVKLPYGFSELLKSEILQLPFEHNTTNMIFILPGAEGKMEDIEQLITEPETLRKELNTVRRTFMEIKIPKFSIDLEVNMKSVLDKIGFSGVFKNPNLSNLFENHSNSVEVNTIMQKSVMEINESGAEANSVASLSLRARSIPIPIIFEANRPFLFLVIDTETSTVLFQGRIEDPTAKYNELKI